MTSAPPANARLDLVSLRPMRWPRSGTLVVLAGAVVAAALGLGAGTAGPGDRPTPGGQVEPRSLASSHGRPLEAIVTVEAARVFVGRLGSAQEHSRAGLPGGLPLGPLVLPALRAALGPRRGPARSAWLSPERYSVALRAPPRPRLV